MVVLLQFLDLYLSVVVPCDGFESSYIVSEERFVHPLLLHEDSSLLFLHLAEEGEELRCLLLSQSGKLRDVSFELFLVLFRIEVSVVILLVWMMS